MKTVLVCSNEIAESLRQIMKYNECELTDYHDALENDEGHENHIGSHITKVRLAMMKGGYL